MPVESETFLGKQSFIHRRSNTLIKLWKERCTDCRAEDFLQTSTACTLKSVTQKMLPKWLYMKEKWKAKCYCIIDKLLWNRSITGYKIKQPNRWSKITKQTEVTPMVLRICKHLACENIKSLIILYRRIKVLLLKTARKGKRKKKKYLTPPNYPVRQVKMPPQPTQKTQFICWQQGIHNSSQTKNTEGN